MSDVDQINALSQVIRRVDGNHTMGAGALAEAILDRRTEWDTPRIIRTVEELGALDPDTLLSSTGGGDQGGLARSAGYVRWAYHGEFDDDWPIPAVVVATGEQVRAARKALEEASE